MFSEDEEEEAASSDSEAYYTGNGRRKRIRAAAMVANAMLSDMDRSVRCGRRSSSPAMSDEFKSDPQQKVEPKPETKSVPSIPPSPEEAGAMADDKRTIGDLMEARTKFSNETGGFKAFADIWSFEKEELQNVASEGNNLMECSSVLSKFKSWKSLKATVAAKVPAVEPDPQPPTRTVTRTGSETESVNSETSTMATQDFNEEEARDDLLPGVSKELTPPPPLPSKLTLDTEVLQPAEANRVELTEQPLGPSGQLPQEASLTSGQQIKQHQEPFETRQPLEEEPLDTRQLKEELIETTQPTEDLQVTEECLQIGQLTDEPLDTRQPTENPPEPGEPEETKHLVEELTETAQLIQQIKEEPLENGQPTQEPLDTKNLKKEPLETEQLTEEPLQTGQVGAAATTSASETDTAEETRCDGTEHGPELKRVKLEPVSKEEVNPPGETADEKKLKERLIFECLSRSPRVCLKMLTVQDIEKLRGVRVRVKRTNLVDYYREQTQSKRRRITGRRQSPSRSHTEDSTASTHSSDAQKSGRRRFTKFVHITSDSPGPSVSPTPSPSPRTDVGKPLFKHITSDSSTDLEEVPPPVVVARRRGRGRGRGAGPRCKTQPIRAPRHTPSRSPDVIELSSDSLSSNSPVPAAGQPMMQFSAMELDPLYEEEIVPF